MDLRRTRASENLATAKQSRLADRESHSLKPDTLNRIVTGIKHLCTQAVISLAP